MSKKNKKTQNQDNLYATKQSNEQQGTIMDNAQDTQNYDQTTPESGSIGADFAADGTESKTITAEVGQVTTVNFAGEQFYSQCEEDKYLSRYFNEYQVEIPRTIVEIGAGRPEEISNSRYWIKEGFKAQLIEPNHSLYTESLNFYKDNENVQVNQLMIGQEGGVGDLAVSKKHWALSMASEDLKDQENHEMQVVGVEPLKAALEMWKEWSTEIGIISIDTEGREMMILDQMIEAEIQPYVILVESQNEADTKLQKEKLQKEYDHIATLSLTNVFILKSARKDIGK